MMTSKFLTEQTAFALKQAELSTSHPKMGRKLGITEQTFYNATTKSGQ